MAIRRLLEGSGLAEDAVEKLCAAYDLALHKLHLVDRNDPITEIVARKVIEVGKGGSDPADIARRVVKALRIEE